MIKYDKLNALLRARGLTSYDMRRSGLISQSTLTRFKTGQPITTATIDKLCELLDCQPGDLMEYIPTPPGDKH